MLGHWLCYRPHVFERGGRNYYVETGGQFFPAQVIDAFTVESEGMWHAAGQLTGAASWRYVNLGTDAFMALCRCALGQQGGTRALVVWALLLPKPYIASRGFALSRLPERFPGPEIGAALPAPMTLAEYEGPSGRQRDVKRLISCYLGDGQVQVQLSPQDALAVFAAVVEQLPPVDRMEVSFSTTHSTAHSLSVSDSAPRMEELTPSVEGQARIRLWELVRTRSHILPEISLRDPGLAWLGACLRADKDLAGDYKQMHEAVRDSVPVEQQEAALGLLRQGLEQRLPELPPVSAARQLDFLETQGLLAPELGVPPMWLARMALKCDCLRELAPRLLTKVLHPLAVPMLIESMAGEEETERKLRRLAGLVSALGRAGEPSSALGAACQERTRALLKMGVEKRVGQALATHLLNEYVRKGSARSTGKPG